MAPFTPPRRSRASRPIPLRGKFSFRGALVASIGGIDRVLVYESLLECSTLTLLLADRSVEDIHDQPPAIHFQDAEGKARKHTLDYLVVYKDSRKVGFAVKPYSRVYAPDGSPLPFVDLMGRVQRAAGHEVRIVTERSFSRVQIQDAQLMHSCSRDDDPDADRIVSEASARLNGVFPLKTLVELSGIEGRAYRAAVRLVREGLLAKHEPQRLTPDALVYREASLA